MKEGSKGFMTKRGNAGKMEGKRVQSKTGGKYEVRNEESEEVSK